TVFGHSALDIFSRTSLSFVPLLNPDGVDLVLYGCEDLSDKNEFLNQLNEHRPDFREWKANINGVDLNKHFPSNWDIE
ncbi:M14 family zinc carboxypeptidase, partial [Bacillus cereus]|uniref:M14 family zinc carboxypeptidase n=1 Tax=Bacillus cereus TaxID=1396 RepID=UPI0024BD5D6C